MSGEGGQSLLELSRVGFQGSGGLRTPPNRSPLMGECRLCPCRSFVIHKSVSVATLAAHWNQLGRF